jgi:hypothetical protein
MVKVVVQDQKAWIRKPGIKITRGFLNMGSVTNLKENKTLFIPCGCRSEILVIEYDHDMAMADIAIYEHYVGYKNKLSLWQRFRYCWQVLFNKKPYADQMMLDNKQLKELESFLSSLDLNSRIGV